MASTINMLTISVYCFLLFSFTFVASDGSDEDSDKNLRFNSDDANSMHLGSKAPVDGKQTLKFLYCYSCGYQKAFDHYSSILSEKYPQLHIIGANYDPSLAHIIGAKILSIAKMLIIIAIASGINFFEFIGKQRPNWWSWCQSNKIYACLVVFFGSNMIEGILISTGAFELYFNDIPVWSKLDTGRIPQAVELFQIIDNYLLFENPYTT